MSEKKPYTKPAMRRLDKRGAIGQPISPKPADVIGMRVFVGGDEIFPPAYTVDDNGITINTLGEEKESVSISYSLGELAPISPKPAKTAGRPLGLISLCRPCDACDNFPCECEGGGQCTQ